LPVNQIDPVSTSEDANLSPSLKRPLEQISHTREGASVDVEWKVIHAVVNKQNTRIATGSYDAGRVKYRTRLWDTASREWLWQQEDVLAPSTFHASATFSEDGRYLGVYFDKCVKVWDTQSLELAERFSLPEYAIVVALAITGNGKELAVTIADTTPRIGQNYQAHLGQMSVQRGQVQCWIRAVWTNICHVSLAFVGDGHRLILTGEWTTATLGVQQRSSYAASNVGICWEPDSSRQIGPLQGISDIRGYFDSPIFPLQVRGAPCAVTTVTFGNKSIFFVWSADGEEVVRFVADRFVCGITPRGLVILKTERYCFQRTRWRDEDMRMVGRPDDSSFRYRYIWRWDGQALQPYCVGRIATNIPYSINDVKGLAETETGLTVALRDGRVIFIEKEDWTVPPHPLPTSRNLS
jgi:hypothetical protein